MKERSIVFSTDDVRAIRERRKTQFRRIAWAFDHHQRIRKLQPGIPPLWAGAVHPARESGWVSRFPGGETLGGSPLDEFTRERYANGFECPYGKPGDRLWVKETWWCAIDPQKASKDTPLPLTTPLYLADWDTPHWKSSFNESDLAWRSATRMPRWASRYSLKVEHVRPERVQEITQADAIAEGIRELLGGGYGINEPFSAENTAREAFAALWDSRNGKRAPLASNPWVWVVDFCIVEQ